MKEVIDLIDVLPSADKLSLADASAVTKAQDAFNSLSEEAKEQISQIKQEKLMAAVLRIAELRKAVLESFEDSYEKTGAYLSGLADQYTIQVNSIGGEWMAIGLARAGKLTEKQAADYYANVEKYVKEKINDKEQLHRAKSTDNARVILALTAIGKDVTNVAGHNLLAGLNDMKYVKNQGINGPIWALIAFDSHGYEIPAGGDVTRDGLIMEILGAQLKDGGWSLDGEEADSDMTAMAIQALAPYYRSNQEVKAAVDAALDLISKQQNVDGGFASWGTTNSESCAQVIVALTALRIDPITDSRFIKNGNSVLDALLGFYVAGGGFTHTAGGEVSGMSTEQGYYALAAYSRMMAGKTSLYDMSDVTITKAPAVDPGQQQKPENPDQPNTPNQPVDSGQPEKKVYHVLVAKDGLMWTVNGDGTVSIRADGAFADFMDLKVDGNRVEPANYTVRAGSTIVTLKADYLKSLGKGNHTVTFVYKDGEASMTLPLGEGGKPLTKAELTSSQTGDIDHMAVYLMLMLCSAACFSALYLGKRRRRTAAR